MPNSSHRAVSGLPGQWDFENDWQPVPGADDGPTWGTGRMVDDGRVQHLVFVDGRLIDSWGEPAFGGPWEAHARRFDRDLEHRCPDPLPPPIPRHQAIAEWLIQLLGDGVADSLTDQAHPQPREPVLSDLESRNKHRSVLEHLARAERVLGPEVGRILIDGLATLWDRDPEATRTRSAGLTAAGLCWVVGNANALFSTGDLTQSALAREIGIEGTLTGPGKSVGRILGGVWAGGHGPVPAGCPKLMPFADPALLTSTTRRLLIRWRDAAAQAAGEACGESPPPADPVSPSPIVPVSPPPTAPGASDRR